jgi:hypothetical protein
MIDDFGTHDDFFTLNGSKQMTGPRNGFGNVLTPHSWKHNLVE